MKDASKKLLKTLLVILFLFGLTYFVAIPEISALSYSKSLDQSKSNIYKSLDKLAKTTSLAVLENPDTPYPQITKELREIKLTIANTKSDLDYFEIEAKKLTNFVSGKYFGNYQKATVEKEKAESLVSQSYDVISEYEKLILFIEAFYGLQDQYALMTSEFNKLVDINVLAGNYITLLETANDLRKIAEELSNTQEPKEAEQLKSETIANYKQTASGFELLAHGIEIPADFEIYAGASQIEDATIKNEGKIKEAYSAMLNSSPTINNVINLPDKVDVVNVSSL